MTQRRIFKAIETEYRSRWFRSRLEARWAVWFDSMGIAWEYEMVGMEIAGLWYLPDFWLPSIGAHVEIKPKSIPQTEQQRIDKLFQAWPEEHRFWLLRGIPAAGEHELYGSMLVDNPAAECRFAQCRRCDGLCFVALVGQQPTAYAWGNIGEHNCNSHDRWPIQTGPGAERLDAAYAMAMRYEFDKGRA